MGHLQKITALYPLLFVALVFSALSGCSADADLDAHPKVIATVGDSPITLRELQESFVLSPQYPLRVSNSEAHLYQLKYLINERYYYLAADAADLHQDQLVRQRLGFVRRREVMKAYVRENFVEKVAVNDLEMVQGLARLRRQLRLQHLFAEDSLEIAAIHNRLEDGEKFEDIARAIYSDPYLQESGGELGFISFGDLEQPLEEAAYRLKVDEISPIVRTRHGYHIIKLLEVGEDPTLKTMTVGLQMDIVNDRIRQRKIDAVIREDIAGLGAGKKIAINNRLLDIVWRAVNTALAEKYQKPGPFALPINNGEISTISLSLEDVINNVIARFDGVEVQVGELLDRIRIMPPLQRPYLRSKSNIAQFMIDEFRRDLLIGKALQQGYDQRSDIVDEIDYHTTQVLAYEAKKRLNSKVFRETFPDEWARLSAAHQQVKATAPVNDYPQTVIASLSNPDSLLTKPPIPLQIKNRYVW